MRWSVLFIPTLRESPAEVATASRQLLVRAGYMRQVAAGVDAWLFLGQRSLARIATVVRAEMEAMGAQEVRLSAEAVRSIARGDLRSYKQLPQIWYQIGVAEASWSLHADAADLDATLERHREAYGRILRRCGVACASSEFMLASDDGEEYMVNCDACGYAANRARAVARPSDAGESDPVGDLAPEAFHTPGRKTIAEVSEFTGLPESAQMKSLVLMVNGALVLAMLRGDHQLSETKLADATGDAAFRPANAAEIREVFGADPGSLGPVGIKRLRILADNALRDRRNMIAGANRDDYHLRYVTPGEDFQAEFMDLRQIEPGDLCVHCGAPVEMRKATEIGYVRRLSDATLHVTNSEGVETPLLMGSYGIRMDRILAAAVELHHDKDGMILPPAMAPFTVVVTPVNIADPVQQQAAAGLYQACLGLGLDALFDDRDERPGVKFKDADLIGVPYRITVGKKAAAGVVELVEREGHKVIDVPVAEAAEAVARRVKESYAG